MLHSGGHTEVVKLLLHFGANVEMKTRNGLTAMDLAGYETESWNIMNRAEYGILPELPPQDDVVPVTPWYALQSPVPADDSKTSKKKGSEKNKQKTRK